MKSEMEGPSRFCFRKFLNRKMVVAKKTDLDCTSRMLLQDDNCVSIKLPHLRIGNWLWYPFS